MDLAPTLGIVGGVLALVALLTGAFVILKSTILRTTNDLWKQEAEALGARLKTVEDEEAKCRTRLAALESANKVLSDQVSGTSAILALGQKIEQNHKDIIGMLGGQRQRDGGS